MDPRLAYWTFALLDLAAVVGFAAAGVAALRRGDVPRHQRRMLTAAALVGLFLLSYLAKLALIGREDLASWEPASIWMLRIHELCVFTMLVGGSEWPARARCACAARATRRTIRRIRRRRRRWCAGTAEPARRPSSAAALALGFAGLVLAGMYRRAGWF